MDISLVVSTIEHDLIFQEEAKSYIKSCSYSL